MIRYALSCVCGARFDAWFRNAESCRQQLQDGMVLCPVCGGAEVEKALMAPSVTSGRESEARAAARAAPERDADAPAAPDAAGAAPAAARKAPATAPREIEHKLRALRAFVEATAEPVGRRFPEEARAIHDGEAAARPIYGEATRDEAEALRDDGVPVAPIPWIDKTDD